MATQQASIQADWENREFIETLTAGIKRIAEFLNNFGLQMKFGESEGFELLMTRSILEQEALMRLKCSCH